MQERIDHGTAELRPDPTRASAWELLIDGVQQSYVDLADPCQLHYPYVRQVASIVDCAALAGAPMRVLHLGGGALTLPRYVAASRPGSAQLVIEHDAALAALVLRELPLPAGADIELRIGDAGDAVGAAGDDAYDLVLSDVYHAAQMPPSVSNPEFTADVARVLAGAGTYIVNMLDLPQLRFTRVQTAMLRAVFDDVCIVGDRGMLRGRRFGNLILAARNGEPLPVRRLAARAAAEPRRGRVLHGAELDAWVAGTVSRDGD